MSAPAHPAWDPLVRITHWGIAAAVIFNGLILEGGEQPHIWVGYAALSLLALRLIWGFIGTEEARFSAFPPSISGAWAHLRAIRARRQVPHRSHNPLGTLMVYAVWATLAVIIATGLTMESEVFLETDDRDHATLIMEDDDDADESETSLIIEEIHEAAANLLLSLALLHVGGVVFEMARGDRSLIRRMTIGITTGSRQE